MLRPLNYSGRCRADADGIEFVKSFLQRWAVTTLAVAVAANVVPGITYDHWVGLLLASLLLGILNAFLRPLLLLLSLPLLLVTLGLFTLVINALLLMLVGRILAPFHVTDFWAAFWGGVVISLVSMAVNALIGTPKDRTDLRTRSSSPGKGGGPVIDV